MIGIITTVIILAYLVFQSMQDLKTMRVLVWPNDLAVVFSIAVYAIDCFLKSQNLSFETIVVVAVIRFFCICGLYGSGDAKAMFVMYLSLRYWGNFYPHPDLNLFLIALLIADLIFLGMSFISRFVKVPFVKVDEISGKRKAAFFPALTIGYISGVLIGAFM